MTTAQGGREGGRSGERERKVEREEERRGTVCNQSNTTQHFHIVTGILYVNMLKIKSNVLSNVLLYTSYLVLE